jgi:hypothetical protein
MKEKNIKDFRIRPLNKDKIKIKEGKNLIIESNLISKSKNKNGFCIYVLKEMKTENNFNLENIDKTFRV